MRSRARLRRIEQVISGNCAHCEAPPQLPSMSLEAFLIFYFKLCSVCGKQNTWLDLVKQCEEL